MLTVENVTVEVDHKSILRNISFSIPKGETHVLFGPNGSGKSSLLMALIGYPRYKITKGRIIFKGNDVTAMSISERARLGMGIMFQYPPTIKGVGLHAFLDTINSTSLRDNQRFLSELSLDNLLQRDINSGFSGGERKRSELMQLIVQQPDMVMLDEPESGVDLENMKIIGRVIEHFLEGETIKKRTRSSLIITHTGYILEYLNADKGYVMLDGELVCSGNPVKMFKRIEQDGFQACFECESG